MSTRTRSEELFSESQKYIPGGVNSPVRAFKSVGGNPIFMKSAKGAYLEDEDGNKYIDLICSWGPMILGHARQEITDAVIESSKQSLSFGTPGSRELTMAKLITEMVPSIEKVRMVNSGTEATMSAVRLARGFTGKNKIIKFEGCYHGHGDSFLIAAGSGVATLGTPDSPGVTEGTARDTLTAPFNDIDAVEDIFAQHGDDLAAVIVEPVAGNMGCVLPQDNFLQKLRDITEKHHCVLIFDEVMTGFRLSKGGAQEIYGVRPDMTTFGKIIGGGMPVGAYGGKSEIMDFVSPSGPVYQAGTLSGNPVAMSAGIAMLEILQKDQDIYSELDRNTKLLSDGIGNILKEHQIPHTINQLGSMFSIFFSNKEVHDFEAASRTDKDRFKRFFNTLLDNGVYWPPSAFEAVFMSTEVREPQIKHILEQVNKFASSEAHKR